MTVGTAAFLRMGGCAIGTDLLAVNMDTEGGASPVDSRYDPDA
jgi:hypothetical protein